MLGSELAEKPKRVEMTSPFIVGVYASLPEPDRHREYYELLQGKEWIDGLEIPFPGQIATEADKFASYLAENWTFNAITAIPGTMQNVGKNPAFGLASPDSQGRRAALDFAEQIRSAVAALADATGREVISKVQLHSAPPEIASADSFRASLEELLAKDWCGASIAVEHCDKFVDGQKPEKGFLPIEQEIEICRELGIGMVINWGRSAIEGRSPRTAFEHIQQCEQAGVLAGVIFSGAGPEETQFGYPWVDGHLPSATDEPASLLDAAEIRRCAEVAEGAEYLGAKICVPASAGLEERLAMLENIYAAARGE